jgi:hypothetical protein
MILNQKMKIYKNNLTLLNNDVNENIWEFRKRNILKEKKTYINPYHYYENIVNVFNANSLLADEMRHNYSINNNAAYLVIERILPKDHPNLFQFSFSILI